MSEPFVDDEHVKPYVHEDARCRTLREAFCIPPDGVVLQVSACARLAEVWNMRPH